MLGIIETLSKITKLFSAIYNVAQFGNSITYTHKVYNKAEGAGDISRVRVIHHQSVSQGM